MNLSKVGRLPKAAHLLSKKKHPFLLIQVRFTQKKKLLHGAALKFFTVGRQTFLLNLLSLIRVHRILNVLAIIDIGRGFPSRRLHAIHQVFPGMVGSGGDPVWPA
ncbi:hypothetical protein D3H65_18795 [Paraflavitalea soli]|uniref:Uncharacterized protein n=1 Tax=Paraflavitalea soli TaxID=2315862 RepID=A0A3B7MN61_9BACT|nr:hypothetical protein D3H65_18795 [Paraflavitalea soli]